MKSSRYGIAQTLNLAASSLEGTMEGWVDGGVLEDRKTRLIIQVSLQIKFTSSCAIGRFGGEAHTQYVNDSFEF